MTDRTIAALRGLMGLCVRARQAVFGQDGCLNAVRGGKTGLLLLDSGASAATREKYRNACENAGVKLALLPEGLLNEATGRPGVAMAVPEGGFAAKMCSLLAQEAGLNIRMTTERVSPETGDANNCGGASAE